MWYNKAFVWLPAFPLAEQIHRTPLIRFHCELNPESCPHNLSACQQTGGYENLDSSHICVSQSVYLAVGKWCIILFQCMVFLPTEENKLTCSLLKENENPRNVQRCARTEKLKSELASNMFAHTLENDSISYFPFGFGPFSQTHKTNRSENQITWASTLDNLSKTQYLHGGRGFINVPPC